MFSFQKLPAYQKAKALNRGILDLIENEPDLPHLSTELVESAQQLILLLAEADSYAQSSDRAKAYIKCKSLVFRCIAVLDYLKDSGSLEEFTYLDYANQLDAISTHLDGMIRKADH